MALALSGGGDSLALLETAARWAGGSGRRLVAITVDHGLTPESGDWTRRCAAAARTVGASWVGRRWSGSKPLAGLPATARRARHGLIAEAAREAGARVVLFGHTADDIAESDWMRARGATLGGLREWSPSPAWPEGRGLMLLRPMLTEAREALRALLRERGRDWIEDSGNARFGRGRARAALSSLSAGAGSSFHESNDRDCDGASLGGANGPKKHSSPARPLPLGDGFEGATPLARTLICAAGHDRLPRAERLHALEARLAKGDAFTATLAGGRIEAGPDRVFVTREAGEFLRRPAVPLCLNSGRSAVWDGRYQITVPEDGWSVVPALGQLARLSEADRAVASRSRPAARGALPVLIRDGSERPVLAWRVATVLNLAPRRLSLALGETTQEKDLTRTVHGEMPPPDLF